MKPPSTTLVLDAAVLISAVLGRSAGALLFAQQACALVTTARFLQRRVGLALALKRPELVALIDDLAQAITVVPAVALEPIMVHCEETLRDAVASCNGSVRDAHVLALARSVEGDIWTTDRDFAGAGVATWSTPNLMHG